MDNSTHDDIFESCFEASSIKNNEVNISKEKIIDEEPDTDNTMKIKQSPKLKEIPVKNEEIENIQTLKMNEVNLKDKDNTMIEQSINNKKKKSIFVSGKNDTSEPSTEINTDNKKTNVKLDNDNFNKLIEQKISKTKKNEVIVESSKPLDKQVIIKKDNYQDAHDFSKSNEKVSKMQTAIDESNKPIDKRINSVNAENKLFSKNSNTNINAPLATNSNVNPQQNIIKPVKEHHHNNIKEQHTYPNLDDIKTNQVNKSPINKINNKASEIIVNDKPSKNPEIKQNKKYDKYNIEKEDEPIIIDFTSKKEAIEYPTIKDVKIPSIKSNQFANEENPNNYTLNSRDNNKQEENSNNFNKFNGIIKVKEKEKIKELLGSYIKYSISSVENRNEKLLCERRYSEFDTFHSYMISKYPTYLIPKLIEKNFATKILNLKGKNSDFLETRKKQLSYYLNYINSHSFLSNTDEFKKFLLEPKFDNDYFKNLYELSFPLVDSIRNSSYSNKFFNAISYIGEIASSTIGNKKFDIKSNDEKDIYEYNIYFNQLLKDVKQLQVHYNSAIDSTKQNSDCYKQLSFYFYYMKEIDFDNNKISEQQFESEAENTKEVSKQFEVWGKSNESLKNELLKLSEEDGMNLKDKIEGYVSLLSGICELISRYYSYLSVFEMVNSIYNESGKSIDPYQKNKLLNEFNLASHQKSKYEVDILGEIKFFTKDYQQLGQEVLTEFIKYLRTEVNTELTSLRKVFHE